MQTMASAHKAPLPNKGGASCGVFVATIRNVSQIIAFLAGYPLAVVVVRLQRRSAWKI